MAITRSTAARNQDADGINTLINAGTTDPGGDVVFKAGATPLLVVTLSAPAAPAASGGVLTFTMPRTGTGIATGTADSFDVRSRDNVVVFSGTVTAIGGGGDAELTNTSIAVGQELQLTSATYTAAP